MGAELLLFIDYKELSMFHNIIASNIFYGTIVSI